MELEIFSKLGLNPDPKIPIIVNLHKKSYDIYIGRPSKWGNPFSHKNGTLAKYKVSSREESIKAYEDWIENGEGQYLIKDLHELIGMKLGCFCKPHSCHGDILVKLVIKYCLNHE